VGIRDEQGTSVHQNVFGSAEGGGKLKWDHVAPKSSLAVCLLNLIQICLNDLQAPDFSIKKYKDVEDVLTAMLSNMSKPSLSTHYQQEVQVIIQQLLTVSKTLSPALCDTLEELIAQSEVKPVSGSDRTFALFISYGSNYL